MNGPTPRTQREALVRYHLTFIGATLTTGGAAVLVGAFLPSLYPVWIARGVNAITLISQHRGAWQVANWLFAVGAGLTLAGLAALTALLNRQPTIGALPTVALALMTLASTLWTANLAFRLTVTVQAAAVSNGGAVPDWYEPLNAWAGALWYAAALTGASAMIGYGLAAAYGSVLPGWTGWLAVALGVVILGLFVITRDVPPVLLYLAPTAFGVAALIRAATANTPPG
jgi:hypothetical protein